MTKPLSTIEQELTAAIERLAPDAGFYQKGETLDFTLEDVLITANKVGLWLWVTEQGRFSLHPQGEAIATGPTWHLGKPFSHQSEECKRFLHSLLCK